MHTHLFGGGAACLLAAGPFLAGYLLILLTPGPNALAVAGVSASGGVRAALPLCAGIGLGAGCLCAGVILAAGRLDGLSARPLRLVSAALLLWVAAGIARGGRAGRPGGVAAFASGFAPAATNPVTAAYFLSASLAVEQARVILPLLVTATAVVFFTVVAFALGNPAVRRAALRRDRQIRVAAAVILAVLAVRTGMASF